MAHMDKSPFKTIHASVRPARVAVLVDKADKDWQNTCLRVIEFYSRLWGGAHNIIIPPGGQQINERFWKMLEAFDPDHLYRYAKSGEDIFLGDPTQFNEWLEAEVQRNTKRSSSSSVETIRKDVRTRLCL